MHTDTKRKGANGHIGIRTCISKKKSKFLSDGSIRSETGKGYAHTRDGDTKITLKIYVVAVRLHT
jgi:hypothetical protein